MKNNSKPALKPQNRLLRSYIACSDGLTSLIEKEITILENGQVNMLEKLAAKKDEFIEQLQGMEKEAQLLSKQNATKDASLLERARVSHEKLQQVMQRSKILLQSHLTVSNQIIEVFKEKQRSQSANLLGYDKEGKNPSAKKLEKHTPAVNLSNKV